MRVNPFLRTCWLVALASLSALAACEARSDRDLPSEEAGDSSADTDVEALTGQMPVGASLHVTTDLNLRSQPSTSASVITVMPAGAIVTLKAGEPNNGFYQIAYQGTTGWSSGKFLEPADDGQKGPVDTKLTTTGDVNLRSGPGTSYSVLAVVPANREVAAVEAEPQNGFYHITYDGLTGWSSGKYLTSGGAPAPSGAAFANGLLWKFKATTLPMEVAVFVPQAALAAPQVSVLVYSHGLNVCSPVAKSPPLSFVTDAPFRLGEVVDASKKAVVLVAPFFDWEHLQANGMATSGSNHKLGIPVNLNGVVAEVLDQVGKQRGSDAPAIGSLLLAGHSRAYGFLNPLAAASGDPEMGKGALAKLTNVWGLDSGYVCSMSAWKGWMKSKPSLLVTQDYRSGTGTADCGQQFAGLAPSMNGQLEAHAVPEAHCDVPATELPSLLDSLAD